MLVALCAFEPNSHRVRGLQKIALSEPSRELFHRFPMAPPPTPRPHYRPHMDSFSNAANLNCPKCLTRCYFSHGTYYCDDCGAQVDHSSW
jgi:hypothetical protein